MPSLPSSSSPLKILISGASIAGPTAAYFLSLFPHTDITVLERFPSLRTGGQNIDIRTTGVTVMRKIPGMEAAVKSALYPLEGVAFVNNDGSRIATLKGSGDAEKQSLVSEFEILRGELSRILVGFSLGMEGSGKADGREGKEGKMEMEGMEGIVERGWKMEGGRGRGKVRYVFGEQIKALKHGKAAAADSDNDVSGPIEVEFLNDKLPTQTYDLVIAADGATSHTRGMGLKCSPRDHVQNLNAWAAYCSIPHDLLEGSKIGHGHSAAPGRFISLGPDPNGSNRVGMWRIYPQDKKNSTSGDATKEFREKNQEGEKALKEYVRNEFKDVGWKTTEILGHMMNSEDFYASELLRLSLPRLYRGNFALIGDAGCAPGPTGTGTSLAMAGAYILAGEVLQSVNNGGSVNEGLKKFDERMRPIVKDMSVIPPGVPGFMAPQTEWGLWARNLVFRGVASATGLGAWFSWVPALFASGFGGDKYGLPDYEWDGGRKGEEGERNSED